MGDIESVISLAPLEARISELVQALRDTEMNFIREACRKHLPSAIFRAGYNPRLQPMVMRWLERHGFLLRRWDKTLELVHRTSDGIKVLERLEFGLGIFP